MAVNILREHSIVCLINIICIMEFVWNHLSVFYNTDSYLYCFCTDTFPFYFFKGYFWLLKTAQDFLFGFNYDLQGVGSFIKNFFYSSIKLLAGRMVAFIFTIFFFNFLILSLPRTRVYTAPWAGYMRRMGVWLNFYWSAYVLNFKTSLKFLTSLRGLHRSLKAGKKLMDIFLYCYSIGLWLRSKFIIFTKKFNYYIAASGISISKFSDKFKEVPGAEGAIDPSPFYLLSDYKSKDDLSRMEANANYYRGPWTSLLRYKLHKILEKQELEAYFSALKLQQTSGNLPASCPLELEYNFIMCAASTLNFFLPIIILFTILAVLFIICKIIYRQKI